MLFNSIRFKITLWYALILGITLFVFSLSVYNIFSISLYGDLDDLLESKADWIAASIDTYWETEKEEAIKEGARPSLFGKMNNINFYKIAQHWLEEGSADPKLANIAVSIFDANGKRIAASRNAPILNTLPREIFDYVLEEGTSFDNLNIKGAEGRRSLLRVVSLPITENSKLAYIVQVAGPLSQLFSALNKLRMTFFIFLPLTVLITAVAGAFLAKLTLNPVNSMIKTIRQITAENLNLRVTIPKSKDEIRKLAETFNDMLTKLDEGFSRERQFIQEVSHELKTPLTILKGELEVTLKRIRSAQEYESTLHSSLEEINRISKIVDDLLTLAKFDSKALSLEKKSLSLNQIISEIIADIDVLAKQKDIKTEFLARDRITLFADQALLKRLFLNLLDNAIKYSRESEKISIFLSKDKGFAKVEISDRGKGIPEEDLPHIFERFYRAERSRKNTGFGLGLAIAKSIVEIHKGRIEAKSKLNEDTTFTILLPLSNHA